jgi:hypothetical protein
VLCLVESLFSLLIRTWSGTQRSFLKRKHRPLAAYTYPEPPYSRRESRPRLVFPTLAALDCRLLCRPLPTPANRTKEWLSRPPVGLLLSPELTLYSRHPPVEYVPDDNELLESENLEIVGEDPGDGSLKTDTIPVRVLTDFSVFSIETGQLVTLRSLLAPRDSPQLASYCAVGYVLPAMENEVDDDDRYWTLTLRIASTLGSPLSSYEVLHFDENTRF